MNMRLAAGLLVGAIAFATTMNSPAQAQYWNNGFNNPYYNNQIGAFGLNPNDPDYFRKAQYMQWLQSQGGLNAGARFNSGYMSGYNTWSRHRVFNNNPYNYNNNNIHRTQIRHHRY